MGLTEKILETYKQRLQGLELVPSDGGCFEVSVDGTNIYSKLATGEFPEWKALQPTLDALVPA